MIKFLNRGRTVYILSRKAQRFFREVINNKVTDENLKMSIDVLMKAGLQSHIGGSFKGFIIEYTSLVLEKTVNKEIIQKCQFLQRLANKSLKLNELVFVLKDISQKLDQNTNRKPESFKLSEHYFGLIEESDDQFAEWDEIPVSQTGVRE